MDFILIPIYDTDFTHSDSINAINMTLATPIVLTNGTAVTLDV